MFQDAHMRTVAKLVGVAAIVALLAYTYFAFVQARNIAHMPMMITVDGKGELFAKPDIATFSFSVSAREADAVTAQKKSADAINAIYTYLKDKGVAEKDIKTTGYSLNPRYEYPQVVCTQWSCPPAGEPKIVGYEVSQSIEVKVRKTDDIGMLITGVGELGATNVSTPSFTIDDDETLKADARDIAIADARAKAQALAKNLGVRIVRMNGYYEDQGGYAPMYGYGMAESVKTMATDSVTVPPRIPTGENKITSNVHITYEVR